MRPIYLIGLVIIGLVALGIAGYLYFRGREEKTVEALADEIQAADPTVSTEEATAQAAAQIAQQAVIAAQQAEAQAGVEEQAQAVMAAEAALAIAQAAAILRAEEEAVRIAAEQAVVRATAERAELEARWRTALATAETQLKTAETAADAAARTYDTQKAYLGRSDAAIIYEHIRYAGDLMRLSGTFSHERLSRIGWNDKISSIRVRPGFKITLYQDIYYSGLVTSFEYDMADLGHDPKTGLSWADRASAIRMSDDGARNKLGRIRAEAIAATTSARLVAERALTIAADVRLLGLLLTQSSRLDQIARAAITKFASIEARLR